MTALFDIQDKKPDLLPFGGFVKIRCSLDLRNTREISELKNCTLFCNTTPLRRPDDRQGVSETFAPMIIPKLKQVL